MASIAAQRLSESTLLASLSLPLSGRACGRGVPKESLESPQHNEKSSALLALVSPKPRRLQLKG